MVFLLFHGSLSIECVKIEFDMETGHVEALDFTGEVIINPTAPTIANTIENACDLCLSNLRITAETIWRSL